MSKIGAHLQLCHILGVSEAGWVAQRMTFMDTPVAVAGVEACGLVFDTRYHQLKRVVWC